jgi:hypothetical protein
MQQRQSSDLLHVGAVSEDSKSILESLKLVVVGQQRTCRSAEESSSALAQVPATIEFTHRGLRALSAAVRKRRENKATELRGSNSQVKTSDSVTIFEKTQTYPSSSSTRSPTGPAPAAEITKSYDGIPAKSPQTDALGMFHSALVKPIQLAAAGLGFSSADLSAVTGNGRLGPLVRASRRPV